MLIEPNSEIRLLSGVPIDPGYNHTLYFSSESDQRSYFAGRSARNFTKQSYQRVNKNRCRLQIPVDKIYNCNYMMFQNTAYGDKWFYAFILQMDYINDVTTEITYALDVMQTWFFQYTPKQCFVQRQHSATDEIGENLEAEPIQTGEYIFADYGPLLGGTAESYYVIIAIVDVGEEGSSADGNLYDGIYGGATLYVYESSDVSGINSKLNEYTQKPDAIQAMYLVPATYFNGTIPADHKVAFNSTSVVNIYVGTAISEDDSFGVTALGTTYKPKNKKLYTYPYTYFHVDNGGGSSLALRYEFFGSKIPMIYIYSTVTQPVQSLAVPSGYKGGDGASVFTEELTINGYPMCSWNTDAYQAWVAQNSVQENVKLGVSVAQTALSLIGAGVTAGVSAAAGVTGGGQISASNLAAGKQIAQQNAVNTGVSLIDTIVNRQMDHYTASIQADNLRGNFNNGGVMAAAGKLRFYGGRAMITAENARRIDDFFTAFGYAQNKIMIPNRTARPKWTYIKTAGCIVENSGMPADAEREICRIYDNGITFWRNADEVGDYFLDNSPGS